MRVVAKNIITGIVYLLVLPTGLAARLCHLLFDSRCVFDFFAQLHAFAPGLPGRYARRAYYNQTLARSPMDVDFAFGSLVTKIRTTFGHRVYVGLYSSVGLAHVGDDTVLANYVSILSGSHQHNFENPDQPIFSLVDEFAEVHIGTGCFIGEKATVMADVGDKTIVGAGTMVVRDIPDYEVAVGNPARVVKHRR
ncbi:MAG: acyltransferase [candidate division Zixibacteria bacterium]|nr:acyltransferase [candidate division Zixibacteria bacterium]